MGFRGTICHHLGRSGGFVPTVSDPEMTGSEINAAFILSTVRCGIYLVTYVSLYTPDMYYIDVCKIDRMADVTDRSR